MDSACVNHGNPVLVQEPPFKRRLLGWFESKAKSLGEKRKKRVHVMNGWIDG